jgi:hypothetical protein
MCSVIWRQADKNKLRHRLIVGVKLKPLYSNTVFNCDHCWKITTMRDAVGSLLQTSTVFSCLLGARRDG